MYAIIMCMMQIKINNNNKKIVLEVTCAKTNIKYR